MGACALCYGSNQPKGRRPVFVCITMTHSEKVVDDKPITIIVSSAPNIRMYEYDEGDSVEHFVTEKNGAHN